MHRHELKLAGGGVDGCGSEVDWTKYDNPHEGLAGGPGISVITSLCICKLNPRAATSSAESQFMPMHLA
jgi:hypothetical protein